MFTKSKTFEVTLYTDHLPYSEQVWEWFELGLHNKLHKFKSRSAAYNYLRSIFPDLPKDCIYVREVKFWERVKRFFGSV